MSLQALRYDFDFAPKVRIDRKRNKYKEVTILAHAEYFGRGVRIIDLSKKWTQFPAVIGFLDEYDYNKAHDLVERYARSKGTTKYTISDFMVAKLVN